MFHHRTLCDNQARLVQSSRQVRDVCSRWSAISSPAQTCSGDDDILILGRSTGQVSAYTTFRKASVLYKLDCFRESLDLPPACTVPPTLVRKTRLPTHRITQLSARAFNTGLKVFVPCNACSSNRTFVARSTPWLHLRLPDNNSAAPTSLVEGTRQHHAPPLEHSLVVAMECDIFPTIRILVCDIYRPSEEHEGCR